MERFSEIYIEFWLRVNGFGTENGTYGTSTVGDGEIVEDSFVLWRGDFTGKAVGEMFKRFESRSYSGTWFWESGGKRDSS